MRKFLSFAFVLVMVFSLAISVMAANDNGVITTNLVERSDGTATLTVTYTSGNNSIKAATFELVGTEYKSTVVPFANKSGTYTFVLDSDVPAGIVIRMTEDKGNKPVVVNGVFAEGFTAPCEHDYVAGEVVPSKIVGEIKHWAINNYEMGYTLYTCELCGETEKRDFDEWITYTVEPNCSQEGYTVRRYIPTGEGWFSNYVDALGHSFEEPTWDDHGWWSGECEVCSWAGYLSYDACAYGHDYVSDTPVEPTCTEQGYTTYTCSRCGDSYDADIEEPLGHDYEWVTTKEPTCTGDGEEEEKCTRGCDLLVILTRKIPALGHNWIAGEITAPTCTEQGFTTHTCDRCYEEKNDNYIDATGHSYNVVVTDPTCTEDGFTTSTCTVCNDVVVDNETDALGHAWDEGIYTNPTREADGYWDHTCTRDDCEATNKVTDQDSQWIVTGATAVLTNPKGNTYTITVTETYSGGVPEIYTLNFEGNAISNNSSRTFRVGPYDVTVSRNGGTYTPGNPQGIASARASFSFDEAAEDDFIIEIISIIRID